MPRSPNREPEEALLPLNCFCWMTGHRIKKSDGCKDEGEKEEGAVGSLRHQARHCLAALQWNHFLNSLKEPYEGDSRSWGTAPECWEQPSGPLTL